MGCAAPAKRASCGGNVMMRMAALVAVGGYRDDFIAGEEPELCVRLRTAGWSIHRIDHEMASHDASLLYFKQWWRRSMRSGYAFAQGAHVHGAPPERHWVWESRRAMIWGAILPTISIIFSTVAPPWGLSLWLAYPLKQTLRLANRRNEPIFDRLCIATLQVLIRFPEAVGVARFYIDRISRHRSRIFEYKSR